MFWQNDDKPTISVTAGSIEDSRDLKTWHHIFIEEKGCFLVGRVRLTPPECIILPLQPPYDDLK